MNKPRLIDANALLKAMNNKYKEIKAEQGDIDHDIGDVFCIVDDLIDEQPTAYDVDAVVERLEKAAKIYKDKAVIEVSTEGHTLDYEHFEGRAKGFLNSIEIVKGGGKHDD